MTFTDCRMMSELVTAIATICYVLAPFERPFSDPNRINRALSLELGVLDQSSPKRSEMETLSPPKYIHTQI